MTRSRTILLAEDSPHDVELTLTALKQMKSDDALKAIPVVILTSSREEADVAESYRLGANAYVVKPIGFQQFMGSVEELGRFWAALNEPPPVRQISE